MYLLPMVKKLEERQGRFCLTYNGEILLPAAIRSEAWAAAGLLRESAAEICGITLAVTGFSNRNVIVQFEKVDAKEICSSENPEFSSQAYELVITEEGINVRAAGKQGWIYAVQTLRQILSQEGFSLPCLTIRDEPALAYRGFMHDVTRSRVPSMKYMKQLVDWCSNYKLNQLQLYFEHTFLFPQFNEMWRDDTPLTADDIMELDRYCQDRGVDLVPTIASFGHLYKLLRTKSYKHLCELEEEDGRAFSFIERQLHHMVDPTSDEAFAMIEEMLTQFASLFSSEWFNICCDETFDIGKGKSKEAAEKVGNGKLYVDFLNKVCVTAKKLGKRPQFWGDILLEHPECMQELQSDGVCLNWDYAELAADIKPKKMAENGITQYLCPGVHGWNHMMNRLDGAYSNVSRMCAHAHRFHAFGVLNTDWGDYGHINHPAFSLPGLIYGAALSWSEKPVSEEEINRQISAVEFGDFTENIVRVLRDCCTCETISWGRLVQYREIRLFGVLEGSEEAFWAQENYEKAQADSERLQSAKAELCRAGGKLAPAQRARLVPYLIACDGQRILNEIAATLEKYRNQKENPAAAKKPAELADRLEQWFYEYKKLWRSVSRESELWQLQETVNWFADELRSY